MGCHTCWLSYFTLVCLWCGRTVAWAGDRTVYGHVITKFSRMGRLLPFLTHGAPLARLARESSAIKLQQKHIYETIWSNNEDGQTQYVKRYVTVRWFSNVGLSVIGRLRIFKLRLCDKICTCLTSYLAKWNFLFVFLFLLGCAESLSIPDKLYVAPRLFYKYLGDKRKTNNQQHKNALIFHVSSVAFMVCKKGKNRSWSFCKTWRPMTCSSKKWTLISNRTAEERRQQTFCDKSDNQ